MASLVYHYQRLLRLDDPAITTKEQAAEALGMQSAGGARFPLEASQRLGTDGPAGGAAAARPRPSSTCAGTSGLDERTVIDVLVARLAALSRRHSRGDRGAVAARRYGSQSDVRGARIRRDVRRAAGVLVDHALGARPCRVASARADQLVGVVGAARRRRRWATLTRVFSSERTPLLRTRRRLVLEVALLLLLMFAMRTFSRTIQPLGSRDRLAGRTGARSARMVALTARSTASAASASSPTSTTGSRRSPTASSS